MGIISYIKGVYYNHRIEKADQLCQDGNEREAEDIYKDLLGKQHDAVSKLASLYYAQCLKAGKSNDTEKEILLYKSIKELKSKGGNNYDIISYNEIVKNTVKALLARANSLYAGSDYQKCLDLMCFINTTDDVCNESVLITCEASIMLNILKAKQSTYHSNKFKSSIDQLFIEFDSRGKNIEKCKLALEAFINELILKNRFLSANYLLEKFTDESQKTFCLENASSIIYEKDSEATANDIAKTALKYGKEIILNTSRTCKESVDLFIQCWKATSSDEFFMEILKENKEDILQQEIINSVLANHTLFLAKDSLRKLFVEWIQTSSQNCDSLVILEKIHYLGYDVKDKYISKIQEFISSLQNEKKIPFINHALGIYRSDPTLLSEKLDCAKWFVSHNKNDEAIVLVDEIGTKINGANLVKAEALFNKAKDEVVLDIKIGFLNNALKAIGQESKENAQTLLESINECYIDTAELYYSISDIPKAYTILHEQAKAGSNRAVSLISEHRNNEISAIDNDDKQAAIESAINELKKFKNKTILSLSSYQNIWDELSALILKKIKKQNNHDAISQLENIITEIDKEFPDQEIAKKRKNHVLKQLIQRKYLVARETELAKDHASASILYREISILESKKSPTLSVLRFVICKLKDFRNSNILDHKENIYSVLSQASDSFSSEKKDIAYRFALALLKSGEIVEAQSVLSSFLPEDITLKKACREFYINKALKTIEKFNHNLELIKTNELSSADAIYFINHMLEYAEEMKPALDISRPVLGRYRNRIKNYAISKLFDEGKYGVAFDKLKKEHANYLDNLTDLRNIAIVCLNMAESGQIDDSNYREVISVWLTAIYQEKLFIKSLDYTSWDNNFTFSLYDAFGHFNENTIEDLPDNVNFDYDGDDKTVMIKEVQRTLLDRFEAAISENQEYHLFFTDQKNSMDSFIALNLDIKCRLTAPYLASNSKHIFDEIEDALEHEREEEYDNWEDVLSVGAKYGLQQSIYNDYTTAENYYDMCIEALDSNSVTNMRTAFTQSRLNLIRHFNKKYRTLLSYTTTKISSLSADNEPEFKNKFEKFSIVCKTVDDSTIIYTFSNFVMKYVVVEVNEERLSKVDASKYILAIHLLDKTNTRVSENLATLLSLLMQEYIEDGFKSILTAINDILGKTRSCDSSLDDELVEKLLVIALVKKHEDQLTSIVREISTYSPTCRSFSTKLNSKVNELKINKQLNDIVEEVNNDRMQKSTALEQVYTLYSKYPDNRRICENLVALCNMCIMEYIIGADWRRKSNVEKILNKLEYNKSVTFKTYRSEFKKAHDAIWNQLDIDTQLLLSGSALSLGQTLNDKGQALQAGLLYYQKLGGFTPDDAYSFLSRRRH